MVIKSSRTIMLLIEKIGHTTIFRKEFYQVAHYKIIHYPAPRYKSAAEKVTVGMKAYFSLLLAPVSIEIWEQLGAAQLDSPEIQRKNPYQEEQELTARVLSKS